MMQTRWLHRLAFLALLLTHAYVFAQSATPTVGNGGDAITLSDVAIGATWSIKDGALRWQKLRNYLTGENLDFASSAFDLVPKEGPVLHSYDFKIIGTPS